MQNVIVNVLLITSLLRTSLMHNDYYLKAQSWASLVSHSLLWIFHQKLVATNPIQLLLSPSFPDHGFSNWRVYSKCYNVATYSFVTMSFSVDGNYTEWSEFQACSVTCGKGIQARSRSCTNPPPQHGGKNCSSYGHPVETKECNLRECPSKDISNFLLSVNM